LRPPGFSSWNGSAKWIDAHIGVDPQVRNQIVKRASTFAVAVSFRPLVADGCAAETTDLDLACFISSGISRASSMVRKTSFSSAPDLHIVAKHETALECPCGDAAVDITPVLVLDLARSQQAGSLGRDIDLLLAEPANASVMR
jgi:hypothetical protein